MPINILPKVGLRISNSHIMAPFSGDGVLWLCLGVSLFFAVRGIATDLRQVVHLTEIKHVEKEDKIISEGTEDALKLDTLLKLSQSTNHDLRAASLRIISERSSKGATRDLLLEDLASRDKVTQARALNALNFLVSNRALTRTSICTRIADLPTFTALVNCLCNFLEEHVEKTTTTNSPILPKTRPMGEKKALNILHALLPENVPEALEAGVISRWLCRYPFPCALAEPSRRRDVVILMKTWWSDDVVMSAIFSTLSSHPDGIKQLRKHGLMGSMIAENDQDEDDDDADSDVWMVDADEADGSFGRTASRRFPEGSPEDQALRRRRREAMVLSDGERPIGSDDIIQRPIEHETVHW